MYICTPNDVSLVIYHETLNRLLIPMHVHSPNAVQRSRQSTTYGRASRVCMCWDMGVSAVEVADSHLDEQEFDSWMPYVLLLLDFCAC